VYPSHHTSRLDTVLTPKRDTLNRPDKRQPSSTQGIFAGTRNNKNSENAQFVSLPNNHTPQQKSKTILSHSAFGRKSALDNRKFSEIRYLDEKKDE
jgi:hypothetical protein